MNLLPHAALRARLLRAARVMNESCRPTRYSCLGVLPVIRYGENRESLRIVYIVLTPYGPSRHEVLRAIGLHGPHSKT